MDSGKVLSKLLYGGLKEIPYVMSAILLTAMFAIVCVIALLKLLSDDLSDIQGTIFIILFFGYFILMLILQIKRLQDVNRFSIFAYIIPVVANIMMLAVILAFLISGNYLFFQYCFYAFAIYMIFTLFLFLLPFNLKLLLGCVES